MNKVHDKVEVPLPGDDNPILALKDLIIESCKRTPSHNTLVQLIRSLAVSVVALVVDFGMLVALKEILNIHYLLAATISFGLGVIVNYYLSTRWVFANRKLSSVRNEFILFVVITTLGLLFNLAIIAGMVGIGKVDYRVGKAVSTVIVFFWNFVARKKILY